MRTSSLLILTLLLSLFVATYANAEVLVIVHSSVPEKTLERESLERIYLGKKSQWSDGSKIVPVVLKSGPVHKAFVKRYMDRDVSQFSTYWKQAVFTGRGVPPKSFASEAELVKFVDSTPGAIGYVSSPPTSENVRALDVSK